MAAMIISFVETFIHNYDAPVRVELRRRLNRSAYSVIATAKNENGAAQIIAHFAEDGFYLGEYDPMRQALEHFTNAIIEDMQVFRLGDSELQEVIIETLLNLMRRNSWTLDQAMDVTGYPLEQKARYEKLIAAQPVH